MASGDKGRSRPSSRDKKRPFDFSQSASEAQLHQSVAELLDWVLLPPAFFTTFPAGWGKLSRGTAGKLFASGLKRGMPDILVFDGGIGDAVVLGIELKAGKNDVTSAQRAMFAKLMAVGIHVEVCRSQDDVMDALRKWGISRRSHCRWTHGKFLEVIPP